MEALVAAGANLAPEENLLRAAGLLRERVRVLQASTFYWTPAIARPEQPEYLNGVFRIEARGSARTLKFEVLRPIEAALGRVRTADKYAARPIDLDVLSFGEEVVRAPDIEVPDPDLRHRAFLLHAVREVQPDFVMPGTGESIEALLAGAKPDAFTADLAFTRRLREVLAL